MPSVGLKFFEFKLRNLCVAKESNLVLSGFEFGAANIEDATALSLVPFYQEADCHARLNAKNIVPGAGELGVGAHIPAQVHDPHFVELARHDRTKAIEGSRVDKAAVADESQHAVFGQPVAGPAEEPGIHVVELGFLRSAGGNVSFLDAFVDVGILAILVVLVLVELVRIVRRVADDPR